MSLASESAAEARRKSASAPDSFDLQLGPTAWSFGAGLDVEANGNIRFTANDAQFDVITRPQLTTRMVWPLSEANSLDLALAAGYSAYALHPEFNRAFIAPGSELSLDLYVGDFWINLHDRLSVTENAYQDPTVVGSGDYSQLQNVAGVAATWDLNKLIFRSGYDHATYVTLSGGGVPEGNSDTFGFSAGYRWRPTTVISLESGGGRISYHGDTAGSPAWDWNVGVSWEAQPMQYVTVKAAAGYTVYRSETSAAQSSALDFNGIYARLGLNHRVNKHLEYNLDAGRSISFGFFNGTVDMYSAVLDARWHVFEKLSLGTGFEFEHGTELTSSSETFDRFGPRLSLDRPLTAKMSGALRYQFYHRLSDVAGRDYNINLVTLNITYRL